MEPKKPPPGKVFKDPIHGDIELHPLCVKIIDTPEFQRLRFVKQLGGCYYLYHGASHNRFEHCIGVCHLAGILVEAIASRQSEDKKVSEEKKLCVKIAGLCHDLGHGPFSHMFEKFVNKQRSKAWKHEDVSKQLVQRIYEGMKKEFKELGNLDEKDVNFIKDLIHPPKNLYQTILKSGVEEKKREYFLYEIVANEANGVDVDKWDYFSRDSLYLGVKNSFDHGRLIASARACDDDDGMTHVAYRDKDIANICEMFHTRFMLHRKAYQHRIPKVIELMVLDALDEGKDEKIVSFTNKDGVEENITLHEAVENMDAYVTLTDDVLYKTKIGKRIFRRELYPFIGEKHIKKEEANETKLKEEITGNDTKMKEQIVVNIAHFDWGSDDKNPVEKAYEYTKDNVEKVVTKQNDFRMLVPGCFEEYFARVYCKSTTDKGKAKKLFEIWKNK